MTEAVALVETRRRITRTKPKPPFPCGHTGEPVWYAPEKWSADWLFDPVPQYQCPRCGRCLGAEPMTYADGRPLFTEDEWARLRDNPPG